MSKTVNYLGMISLALVLVATILKVNHLPGAAIALILGLGSISIIFLPVAYVQLLTNTSDNLLKWVYHAAFISFFIDFVGMIFKVLHWPGASILMTIGVPLPFVLFLPLYMRYHNKRQLKTDSAFFSVVLFMIYLGVFSSLLAI